MWMLLAALSAVFAGLTSILAKCGIRQTDSNVATAIRTIVAFSYIVFHEKLTRKSALGLALVVLGTLAMVV